MITPSLIKEKNNDISLYLGLISKSPTVLRKAIVTTPYSAHDSQKYTQTQNHALTVVITFRDVL